MNRTVCWRCGKVLTTTEGKREEDAIFDSALISARKITDPVSQEVFHKRQHGDILAWCMACYGNEKNLCTDVGEVYSESGVSITCSKCGNSIPYPLTSEFFKPRK